MPKFIIICLLAFQMLIVATVFLINMEIKQLHMPRIKSSMFDVTFFPEEEGMKEENGTLNVQLLIMVLSAHSRGSRRMAIRETWWQECKNNKKVACYFVTDDINVASSYMRNELEQEVRMYKDLLFLPTTQGILFGHRFLYLIQRAMSLGKADFVMRIDDDVMLCVDHLLHDLPSYPKTNFHWGWLHCMGYELVYIDEGITMFSRDIIELFLSQSQDQIVCHPYGDQTYTIWIQTLNLNRHSLYHIDTRIHHRPPASHIPQFRNASNLCQRFVALHGVYERDLNLFWKNRGEKKYTNSHILLHPKDLCMFPPDMNWMRFFGMFRNAPQPCKNRANWNTQAQIYGGRQGG